MRFLLIALAVTWYSSCQPIPGPIPVPPEPQGDAAPPVDPCEAQCAREHELNCPEWRAECPEDCRRADEKLAELGSPPPDHACVAHSVSCAEARRCH